MKEEYVSYSQAVALKECGFGWTCDHYYTKENAADDEVWLTSEDVANWNTNDVYPFFLKPLCSAPTQALAQKWMRDVKKIDIEVTVTIYDDRRRYSSNICYVSGEITYKRVCTNAHTYELALSAGLDAAFELIKQK